MRRLKIKKIYESKNKINGMLSKLCDMRNAIYYQDKQRNNCLIDIFNYNFNEIDYIDLFDDKDKIYVIQTASNKFLEVDKEGLTKFEY